MTKLGATLQNKGIRNLNNISRNNFISDARYKRGNQYWVICEKNTPGWYDPESTEFSMDYGRYSSDDKLGFIWTDTLIERNYVTRCHIGEDIRKIG